MSASSIFGPWSIVRPVNNLFKWINQMDNGTFIGVNKNDNGIYTASAMAGPWTRQGAQTLTWGPIIASDGTLVAVDTDGNIVSATTAAGTWTTYANSPISPTSPPWWPASPAAAPTPGAAPSPSPGPPNTSPYKAVPAETVLPPVMRAYKLASGTWIAIQPWQPVNQPMWQRNITDPPGSAKLYYASSPAGPWTWDPNWRVMGEYGSFQGIQQNNLAYGAFQDPDNNDVIVYGGSHSMLINAQASIYKANSPTFPTTWTKANGSNTFNGIGKVSPAKRLFLERFV